MSEVASVEVKTAESPRSWFGLDSVFFPLITSGYVAAVITLSEQIEIANRTPITLLCLTVALFFPMVMPLEQGSREMWAMWKNRKA
jgi:hypothetical protein